VALDDLHGPNRVIRRTGSDCIYVAGPGHGGPALLGNVYLEGTYSETYPEVGQDLGGHTRFVRQFSTPGGVPSHVNVQTPGSIHVCAFLRAQGWDPILVAGDDPSSVIAVLPEATSSAFASIRTTQRLPRSGLPGPWRWPVVLRTPEGWTGPDIVDGVQVEEPSAPTRSRSPGHAPIQPICGSWKPGCT
jgi:phosphoketolase